MKNINPSRVQGTKRIGTFTSHEIEKTASKNKFRIRRGGKISATVLLESFIVMMRSGVSSYWQWAVTVSALSGTSVSKQAIFKRMGVAWLDTVKALVAKVVAQQGDAVSRTGQQQFPSTGCFGGKVQREYVQRQAEINRQAKLGSQFADWFVPCNAAGQFHP